MISESPYATTRRLLKRDLPCSPGCIGRCGGSRLAGYRKEGTADLPVVSIIIAVRNRVDVIENALRSVLFQRYDNIELIVIDGESTDGTVDVLERYSYGIDYWVSEKDDGIYWALNKGIDAATGDWLYFLGSDDVMLDCLHLLIPQFRDPHHVYYGDVYYPTRHEIFGGEFSAYDLMNRQIPHQATFYPRELFRYHRFDTEYISASDHAFNIVCFNDPAFNYRYLPILVAVYEDTSGYSTLKLDKKFDADFPELLKRHFLAADYRRYRIRKFFRDLERLLFRKGLKKLKQLVLRNGRRPSGAR